MLAQQSATELIHTFLTFHGLWVDGGLLTASVARPGEVNHRSRFTVQVTIASSAGADPQDGPWLRLSSPPGGPEMDMDELLPDQYAAQATARALEWVLQQLLDYPDVLEIAPESRKPKRPARGRGRK